MEESTGAFGVMFTFSSIGAWNVRLEVFIIVIIVVIILTITTVLTLTVL